MSTKKKYGIFAGVAVLTPLLLLLLTAILLYLPPVQNWAVKRVAAYASESTGMDISVKHVNLSFPLRLEVEGVKVYQPSDIQKNTAIQTLPNKKDTIADIGSMLVDVQLLPLLKSQVMVDGLEFSRMRVNTAHFIHEARIKGDIGSLSLQAHGIDLKREHVQVDDVLLADSRLSVELSDTVPEDTTPSTNYWKINISQLKIKNTDFSLRMPGDTLQIGAYLGDAVARTAYMDLYKGLYQVSHIDLQRSKITYDNYQTAMLAGKTPAMVLPAAGMDFDHLGLRNMALSADSFYFCKSDIDVRIRSARFAERSGLQVDRMAGRFVMDSVKLQLPDMYLQTPYSRLQTTFSMDMNAFDVSAPGKLTALLRGSIGREDLMLFAGQYMPAAMRSRWPYYPLSIEGTLKGNLQRMTYDGLEVSLPTAFRLNSSGTLANLTAPSRLKADIRLDAKTYNLAFLTGLLDPALLKELRIPSGIGIKGSIHADGPHYATRLCVTEGRGRMDIDAAADTQTGKDGTLDMAALAYRAKVKAVNVQPRHFLPHQELYAFTGSVEAEGRGVDLLSAATRLNAKAQVKRIHYGRYDTGNIQAVAHVANGKVHADVDSKNAYLTGRLSIDALTATKDVQGTVVADVRAADLWLMGLTQSPMKASVCGHADLHTDLNERHSLQAVLGDIAVQTKQKTYHPVDVVVDLMTNSDTTHAVADCGDFHLRMDTHGGYRKLLSRLDVLQNELKAQFRDRSIDQIRIRREFPLAHIYLTTGRDNFISRFIEYNGYHFKSVEMLLDTSPKSGVNGYLNVDSLVAQGVQLDTVRAKILTQGDTIRYTARIQNNKNNPQYVFRALVDGELQERGSDISASIYDANGRLGVKVGLAAIMYDNGIRVSLTDTHPVLGYKTFTANDDNYLMLGRDMRVSANLLLTDDKGMGVRVYSNDENEEALQDITIGMSNFDLDKVFSVIPYMPEVSGNMNGDFHIVQTKENLSVASNITVDNLVYEKCAMGNVGSDFVYMPKDDGTHAVDGILKYDGEEVATIQGSYRSEGEGYLDARLSMDKLPLHFINGFVPDQLIGLKGRGEGELTVKGALDKPQVDGEIYLDSVYLVSVPYGVSMRFDNDPVRISGSKLLFENFMMYANNDSPLNVQGYLDFSDLDKMMLDVKMRAQNFLLVDAKENARSEAFGKAYVNFFGSMQGALSNLKMRGKLDVLGNTDMTYILRESELTTDTQLDELVKFTDFNSGKEEPVVRPKIEGFDMLLGMSIDESARILCALNADKTNYIDLMGGGDLRMTYNPVDNLQLSGKYTLSNGEMKYSLPIIPLKTFTIQDGSYLEFTGDPFDPSLNITATESVKTTVNEGQGTGRTVDFLCGVKLSQTLSQPGIQFIISAPSDMTMQDELNTMSIEERGKVAITMLASGMYLSSGNTSSFTMNSALSSFLNSEINNIAGTAMRSIGLDIGMTVDNSVNAAGAIHTDYNFKFAKRFFNNRLSFTVGGQVSSGAEMENAVKNDAFFSNVEIQYRLNDGASQYIRGFYNNNTYDWLEGQIGEYGIGFKWQRKLQNFLDIFRFKTDSQMPPVPRDSAATATSASPSATVTSKENSHEKK